MKKRILANVLAASMAVSLCVGCGGGNEKADADNAGGGSSSEYPLIKAAYTVGFSDADEPQIEEALNEIMREEAQAEVDLVGINFGDWTTQLNLMLTGSGEQSIDLFDSFWYAPLATLVSNGQVLDITEYMDNAGSGIKVGAPLF